MKFNTSLTPHKLIALSALFFGIFLTFINVDFSVFGLVDLFSIFLYFGWLLLPYLIFSTLAYFFIKSCWALGLGGGLLIGLHLLVHLDFYKYGAASSTAGLIFLFSVPQLFCFMFLGLGVGYLIEYIQKWFKKLPVVRFILTFVLLSLIGGLVFYVQYEPPNRRDLTRINAYYYKSDGSVYFFEKAGDKSQRIWWIDPDTTEVINNFTIKDKDHVYYLGKVVKGADPETTKPFKNSDFKFQDKNGVWLRGELQIP